MASLAKRLGLAKTRTVGWDEVSPIGSDDGEKQQASGSTTAAQIRTEDELEANRTLRNIKKKHHWDPNLPSDLYDTIDEATAHRDAKEEIGIVEEIVDDSPYPEVRAAARNVRAIQAPGARFRLSALADS